MVRIVLAVFDVQAQSFGQPIFVPAKGVGIRTVADEVNRPAPDNILFQHSADFRLFELGEWDDATGIFKCHQLPVLVVDCSTLKV